MAVGAVAEVCRDADDVARLVVRHHRVRVAKQPVLTVVAGPVASAERLLAALDRGLGRDVVAVGDVALAVSAWASAIVASPRLRATLATRLAPGAAPVSLRAARTLHDWRKLLGAARLDDGELPARLSQAIAAEDARGLARLVDGRGRFVVAALDALVALVGGAALPGLRVRAGTKAQLERATALLVALVDRPPLAAELVAPWSVTVGWLDEPSGARSRGLAADGLLRLPDRGVRVSQRFRSRPERLLHQALEAEPSTHGHFHANQKLGPYGQPPRKIEVDLLCAHHRLVVEVDGFFHQQDGARVRDAQRDRWLGDDRYQVTRISADEVVADPAHVARAIGAAVSRAIAAAARRDLQQDGAPGAVRARPEEANR